MICIHGKLNWQTKTYKERENSQRFKLDHLLQTLVLNKKNDFLFAFPQVRRITTFIFSCMFDYLYWFWNLLYICGLSAKKQTFLLQILQAVPCRSAWKQWIVFAILCWTDWHKTHLQWLKHRDKIWESTWKKLPWCFFNYMAICIKYISCSYGFIAKKMHKLQHKKAFVKCGQWNKNHKKTEG